MHDRISVVCLAVRSITNGTVFWQDSVGIGVLPLRGRGILIRRIVCDALWHYGRMGAALVVGNSESCAYPGRRGASVCHSKAWAKLVVHGKLLPIESNLPVTSWPHG